MGIITDSVQWLMALGPVPILSGVMFLIALAVRTPWRKGLINAMLVGIGLQGLFMVIDLIVRNLEPAMDAFARRIGWHSTIIDVSWGVASLAFGWPGVAPVYIGALIVNGIMLWLKLTRTLWSDIWGMWHCQVLGAVIWATTGSAMYGIAIAIIVLSVDAVLGDWTKKRYQTFLKIPGVSFPAGSSVHIAIMSIPVFWIIDHTPFLKNVNADVEAIRRRFGVFGEPAVTGLIVGAVLGLVSGYNAAKLIGLAFVIAAFMVILPRMVSIVIEGLLPITEDLVRHLRDRMNRTGAMKPAAAESASSGGADDTVAPGEEPVAVSVDVALQIGPPAVVQATIIAVPLIVLMGAILPGNQFLVITSLATIPYYLGAIMPWAKGNVLKAVIALLIITVPVFYTSTYLAPATTAAFGKLGLYSQQIGAGKSVAAFGLGGGDVMAFAVLGLLRLLGLAKW